MKEIPTLTIGVPCRNEAPFIGECLASLISQDSATSFRVVVSDNNSQDGTASIVERMISTNENPRCELVLIRTNEDLSAGENFKRVFDNTEPTPLFMWLGAHDALSENFVREGTQLVQSDEGCSMATGKPYSISPLPADNSFSSPKLMGEAIYNYSQEDPIQRYLTSAIKTKNCTVFHSIFRRAALQGYAWKDAPSADQIMISRFLWHGKLRYFDGSYIRRYFKRDVTLRKKLSGRYDKNLQFFESYISDFYQLLAAEYSDFVARTYSRLLFEILLDRYGFPLDASWSKSYGAAYRARNFRLLVQSLGKSAGVQLRDSETPQGPSLQHCPELFQPPNWLVVYLRYVLMRIKKALAQHAQ